MATRRWRTLALGAAVVLSAACATKSDLVDFRDAMHVELDSIRVRQDSLAQRMSAFQRVVLDTLASQESRTLVGGSELQRQLDDMRQMLSELRELSGQNQRWLSQMQAVSPASGAPTSGQPGASEPTGGGETSGSAQSLYEAALGQFRRGSYETARAGFDEFLSRFPKDDLAPDAQYYRAETLARTNQADSALAEFARVLELYPNSRRAPAALYRSGTLELQRGNLDDARLFFTRVVKGYPDSDEAKLAGDQLKKLK